VLDLPVTILERAGLLVVERISGLSATGAVEYTVAKVAVDLAELCGELRLDFLDVEGRLVTAGRELDARRPAWRRYSHSAR
jgi:hypothetical protein